jgi:hypothetical protein
MGTPNSIHIKALERMMSYVLKTPERGTLLKPSMKWNVKVEHLFVILGWCDASYQLCLDAGRSMSGISIFVQDACTKKRSNLQNWLVLSDGSGAGCCDNVCSVHAVPLLIADLNGIYSGASNDPCM